MPSTTFAWFPLKPIGLRTSVIFTVFASAIDRSPALLVVVLAAELADRRGIPEVLEPGKRRPHHVVRVGRADRLRQHVLDPRGLDDRTDRAAGDDAGTVGRRLEQDLPGAETAQHR